MNAKTLCVAALAAPLLLVACEEKKPQPPLTSPKPVQAPAASAPAAPASPHAAPAQPAASPTGPEVALLGVKVTLPEGWKRNPPANQMRLAEAEVPDPSGDAAKSCLVVFSTAGGSVEDNLSRWSGQVRDEKGQPVAPKSEARTVNGVKVTSVEMSGNFAGMGDAAPRPNWTLRGAIIETSQGLLFIKMTGPSDRMGATAPAFSKMIDSITKS